MMQKLFPYYESEAKFDRCEEIIPSKGRSGEESQKESKMLEPPCKVKSWICRNQNFIVGKWNSNPPYYLITFLDNSLSYCFVPHFSPFWFTFEMLKKWIWILAKNLPKKSLASSKKIPIKMFFHLETLHFISLASFKRSKTK